MLLTLHDVEERVQIWNRSRMSLADQLRQAATKLVSPGELPFESLDEDISEFEKSTQWLQQELGLSCSPNEALLPHLESRLASYQRAASCLTELSQLNHIRVISGDSGVLATLISESERIQQNLDRAPWQHLDLIESIESGCHPLCQVIHLLKEGATLSDEEWTRVTQLIQERFGAPLATAITRGRLVWTNAE